MQTTKHDLGFPPKKKMATYGKAFRKRSQASTSSAVVEDDKERKASPINTAKPSVWDIQDDDEIVISNKVLGKRPQPAVKASVEQEKTEKKAVAASAEPKTRAHLQNNTGVFSKSLARRPQPAPATTVQQGRKASRMPAPDPEPKIWDFPEDDELSTPHVTPTRKALKQYGRKHDRTRPIPVVSSFGKIGETRNDEEGSRPKKRRVSSSQEERSRAERSYSSPASSPLPMASSAAPPVPIPTLPRKNIAKPLKATSAARPSSASSPSSSGSKVTTAKNATNVTIEDFVSKVTPHLADIAKSLDPSNVNTHKKQFLQERIPFRPTNTIARNLAPPRQQKMPTSNPARVAQKKPLAKRRQRLIDTLTAQADESSEDEEEMSPQEDQKTPDRQDVPIFEMSTPTSSNTGQSRARSYARQESLTGKAGLKHTYSSQRRILSEDPLAGDTDGSKEELLLQESLLAPDSSQFEMDGDEDEPFTSGAVLSIHELRQAGANSRSADRIEDLLTCVGRPTGKPSFARRNALLELSYKLQDRRFCRQFRDYNGDRELFEQIGSETDVIAGCALAAILITLLASTTSRHITGQLRSQGVSSLLTRLLAIPRDVAVVAKDRSSNLSRRGQESVEKLKAGLLKLSVWGPTKPTTLSPRRLALKSLDLVAKQSVGDNLFTSEVTDWLFSILSEASDPESWDFPERDESVDFHLALSLLESHSIQAMQTESRERWTSEHLPLIADTLDTTLRLTTGGLAEIGLLTMKLTLNLTNNNQDVSNVFGQKGMVRTLAEATCDMFRVATSLVADDEAFAGPFNSLLLMLGVMINFSEHDPAAGSTLLDGSNGTRSPLDRLIKLFLDHHSASSDADSQAKSELNVAFGYLSLLLGYLLLYHPVRQRFRSLHGAGNLDPLLDSLREFIAYHKVADDTIEQEGNPSRPYSSFTVKIEGLVEKLENGI